MEKIVKSLALQIKDLLFGFSKKEPINSGPWNFEIEEGKLVAVIGANGSGKTSLLRALMGEPTFLSGTIRVPGEGKSVNLWNSKKVYQYFSYLPQESFFDPLQLAQHQLELAFLPKLGFWGQIAKSDRRQIELLVQDLDLRNLLNRRLQDLSAGERQKVFLGRALLQPSKIVLLDEPTNHLDPDIQEMTWKALKNQAQRRTILVATHDLQQLERHCDEVIALSKRKMLFKGSLAEYSERDIKHQVFPLIG